MKNSSIINYLDFHEKSINNSLDFWAEVADEDYLWHKKWSDVLKYDKNSCSIEWFKDGELNIVENCIDRHLNKNGEKVAIIFEPEDINKNVEYISYNELHSRVCKMSNVLKKVGIKKGDLVCIYLPMVPDLLIFTLACARIGAIHSVFMAGLPSEALVSRINDCESEFIVTADGGVRDGKQIDLKEIVDTALNECPKIKTVLLLKNNNTEINFQKDRDQWIDELLNDVNEENLPEIMKSEDSLFISYSSGSTGKPKGFVHSIGGYMVYCGYTFKNVFKYDENDVFWCSGNFAWITGHSYMLYGALLNGATTLLYEGSAFFPNFNRYWEIIEKHKVTQFYTAPTLIRTLSEKNISLIDKFSMKSLKTFGLVGEPIDDKTLEWIKKNIENPHCEIIDTWWQTETGGIMLSPINFKNSYEQENKVLPLLGVQPVLMDEFGIIIKDDGKEGILCFDLSWPGVAKTILGDHERYKNEYFKVYDGKFFSGDKAIRYSTGHYKITGRSNDYVFINGKNIGTTLIERSINNLSFVLECAVVGYVNKENKNGLCGYIVLNINEKHDKQKLIKEINEVAYKSTIQFTTLNKIQFVLDLPKTNSGKIVRRILKAIANKDYDNYGDITVLSNPSCIIEIEKVSTSSYN